MSVFMGVLAGIAGGVWGWRGFCIAFIGYICGFIAGIHRGRLYERQLNNDANVQLHDSVNW